MNEFKSVIQEICIIVFGEGGGAKGRNHVSFLQILGKFRGKNLIFEKFRGGNHISFEKFS